MHDRHILVVHPVGQIFNIPCVPNIADALGRDGGTFVQFAAIRNETAPPGRFGPGVAEVSWFPKTTQQRHETVAVWFWQYTGFVLSLIRQRRPSMLLAIGLRGLIVAFTLHLLTGVPFSFYNLECYPGSKPAWRRIARVVENICLSRIKLLIIHDETRLQLYQRIMGRRFPRVVYFPNAPLAAEHTSEDTQSVIKTFGLEAGRKYVLYSGGMYSALIRDIVRVVLGGLGNDWGIIFQAFDGFVPPDVRAAFAGTAAGGQVILKTTPLSVREYNALIGVARIGLAVYSTADDNMKYVGLSSGKIGSYWRAGLPVIVNDVPFYDKVCPQHHSGEVFRDAAEIPGLVAKIDRDFDAYQAGALACYNAFFNEGHYLPKLWEEMRVVCGR